MRFWQILTSVSLTFVAANQAHAAPKVLYVGDSIAVETSDTVAWWAKNYANVDTSRSMFGGLAICDFTNRNDNGETTLRTRVKEDRPDVVVMQFSGNRLTNCMQNLPDDETYYRKYYSDAEEATRQISAAANEIGLSRPKILWVLQGPSEKAGHSTRLNSQYKEIAQKNGDFVSDAGREVSMAAYNQGNAAVEREKFTRFVPCSTFERDVGYCTDLANNLARVHKDQDGVHYCLGTVTGFSCDQNSPGILRYGMHIANDIKSVLDGVLPR